ncbi:MAG: lysine exporter LysO family protein [Clostridia bacterium]|nr:lysine exporter LysO family protein [Clostridia bacterium]
MSDLLLYLGFAAVGAFLGSKARKKNMELKFTGPFQTVAITCLVLTMGLRMGSNEEVIDNLGSIGLYAFIMTVVTLALVVIGIYVARKIVKIDKYGRMIGDGKELEDKSEVDEKPRVSKMTIFIVCGVAVGMILGYTVIRPMFSTNYEVFNNFAGLAINVGLCVLLLFVGIDIGMEGTVVENFKKVGARIFIFPVVTIVMSLLAGVICTLFMPFSLKEGLAIAAGFGWYSLAPVIIMEHNFITASAISFMHNVMRELFSILLIPLIARKVGYVETTGMPGAAAMDVCLPIVERATSSDVAVYSFISGVILSFLVPILVPIMISL